MMNFWPFNIRRKQRARELEAWVNRSTERCRLLYEQGFQPIAAAGMHFAGLYEAMEHRHILTCYEGGEPWFTNANDWPPYMNLAGLWWRPVVGEMIG